MIGPLPYVGGKRRLALRLLQLVPEHRTYVEPFAGGAQVFFHKPRSRTEVINDLDSEVSNFFAVVQRHPTELVRLLRWQPASRRQFERHVQQPPELLTDIERAVRFFYLQKNCWSGIRNRHTFHYAVTKPSNYRPDRLPATLQAVAERLDGVQIENLPYQDILRRYDRPTTFFYCDPPYVDVRLYQHNFGDADFESLADRLAELKGRFLLSINDCPKSRHWFRRFECLPVRLTYTATRHPREFQELLFANYPLPPSLPRLPEARARKPHVV